MSYRIMFILNAIVVVVFGAFFFIMPQTALTQFGITEGYVSTLLVARFFGGAMLMSGIFIWFLKDIFDQKTQKSLEAVMLAGSVGGFVLSLIGTVSSGVIRTNGWILLVITIVFSMCYAFLLFLMPQTSNTGGYQKQV
ncbi:MAG: hypothetical protein MUO77_19060 [Anaerolineales bacterium]|nr:hypothetical protein [Anaerolineales bacterium]